jgi:N-acetylmuramoyl-L-alanine amidase
MSRTTDENDPLAEEIKECNAFNPDLAADIHANAGKGDGFEAYCHYLDYKNDGPSKLLAEKIEAEVVALGQNSRGIKYKLNSAGKDYYGFIRSIKAPAVILESAFIDNKTDLQFIDTEAERIALGKAYARGILKYLNVDIAAPWYEESKAWCVNRRITDGTRPNDPATRAEVWAMIHRSFK